jgi:hypothetical protein
LHVISAEGNVAFLLHYKDVSRFEVDFPGETTLFPVGEFSNFGDWGHDELTLVSPSALRHEILFASGATILIEFTDIQVSRSAAK